MARFLNYKVVLQKNNYSKLLLFLHALSYRCYVTNLQFFRNQKPGQIFQHGRVKNLDRTCTGRD